LETGNFDTFEAMTVKLRGTSSADSACIALVYRPLPSSQNGFTVNGFINEFEEFVSNLLVTCPGRLFMVGDFNFHMENTDDPRSRLFSSVLSSFNLKQHVNKPTH
jgi:hypothetical protein